MGHPAKIAHSDLRKIEIQNDQYGRPFIKPNGHFKEMPDGLHTHFNQP